MLATNGVSRRDRRRLARVVFAEVDYDAVFQHAGRPDGTLVGHIASGIRALASRRGDSDPPAAYALLFYAHTLRPELQPRLWVGLDPEVVAVLATCAFACSPVLATEALTPAHCAAHALPAFDASWTLVAIAAAAGRGVGDRLVLAAVVQARRRQTAGLVHVGVCRESCGVFERLGFTLHAEPGRVVCYARAAIFDAVGDGTPGRSRGQNR